MARNGFDFPNQSTPVVDSDGTAAATWYQTFSRWHNAVIANQQSGTTANRPTALIWVGRRFYDTTLNKPIWASAVNPIVWRDATSAIV